MRENATFYTFLIHIICSVYLLKLEEEKKNTTDADKDERKKSVL